MQNGEMLQVLVDIFLKLTCELGDTYQDASNLKELEELRTCLEVKMELEHCQLVTPFPSLNTHILGVSEQSHSEELQVCSMASAATPPGNIAVATSGSACSNEVCGSNVEMEKDCGGGATAELAQKLAEVLEDAVRVRVRNAPRVLTPPTSEVSGPKEGAVVMGGARVAVLFSGGVDSAVIAGLVDRYVCVCVCVCVE